MKDKMKRTVLITLFSIIAVFISAAIAEIYFIEHSVTEAEEERGDRDVVSVDLDGDFDVDLIVAEYESGKLVWWENDGNETFDEDAEHTIYSDFDGASSVFDIDLDQDGDVDIVATAFLGDEISWFENDGNENFTRHPLSTTFFGPRDCRAVDIDNDGDLDILSASYQQSNVTLWENDGNENFSSRIIINGFGGVNSIFTVDMDNDNDIDILAAGISADRVAWWENDGSASPSFEYHLIRDHFKRACSVYATDWDNDGDMDVMATAWGNNITHMIYIFNRFSDGRVSFFKNNGNQTFQEYTNLVDWPGMCDVYSADVNEDGYDDVVTQASASYKHRNQDYPFVHDVSYWEYNPVWDIFQHRVIDNSFASNTHGNRDFSGSVHVNDLSGDGLIDIIAAGMGNPYKRWGGTHWWGHADPSLFHVSLYVPRDLYVMLGIPVMITNGSAQYQFGPELDNETPGPVSWRMSRWSAEDSTYVRLGEPDYPIDIGEDPPDMIPGTGYWFVQDIFDYCILRITASEYLNGGLVSEDERYAVPLNKPVGDNRGLTQIANPFVYMYDWRSTYVRDTDSGEEMSIYDAASEGWLNGYAGVWDVNARIYRSIPFYSESPFFMRPWLAFWVEQLDLDRNLEILFTPKTFDDDDDDGMTYANAMVPADRVSQYKTNNNAYKTLELNEDEDWILPITISNEQGDVADLSNAIGANSESNDAYDFLDAMDFAPNGSEYVRLFFKHEDWDVLAEDFTFDIRSTDFTEPKEWEFTVRVRNLANNTIYLEWPELASVPAGYFFKLYDGNTDEFLLNLDEALYYTFETGDSNALQRHFKIVVEYDPSAANEDTSLLPERYEIQNIYPNPFNPSTAVSITLPQSAELTVLVFNLMGQQIATLARGHYEGGQHSFIFDGSDLSSGIYFVNATIPDGKLNDTRKIMLIK